jgi:hypothetical protein
VERLEELPIPAAVFAAKQRAELARIWLADGNQILTISPRTWDDPAIWGLMLADFARHLVMMYEERGVSRVEAFTRIKEAFEAEWLHPTDTEDSAG